MTDRQRALVSALVYTLRNKKFFSWHRIGVKRLPDGAKMYEFNGELRIDKINLQDDKYNKIIDEQYYENPYAVKFEFIGKKETDRIKLILTHGSILFYGEDGDNFKYEGTYYDHSDQVEIKDFSQDKDRYLYQIIW